MDVLPLAHTPGSASSVGTLATAVLLAGAAVLGALLLVRAGRGGRRRRRRVAAWLSALLVLGIALGPPLDPLAEALLVAHMVQHLLLLVVVAPLLVAAGTLPVLLAGPRTTHRVIAGGRSAWRGAAHALHRPGPIVVVAVLHVAVLLLWHVPALYEAALRSPAVHLLEHASFLAVAVLFWWSVAVASRRRDGAVFVAALVSCGLAVAAGLLLAVLMTFATDPWYSHHHPAAVLGLGELDPLADQQLAGVVMWLAGGPAYVAAAVWLLAGVLRRRPRGDAPRLPATLPGQLAQPTAELSPRTSSSMQEVSPGSTGRRGSPPPRPR